MKELRRIKRLYGENMAHLCRELFPTILETEGLLTQILESNFAPNHALYQCIKDNNLVTDFQNYIYGFTALENKNEKKYLKTEKSPQELLSEIGYDLYECKTVDEVNQFKKYYHPNERICTFNFPEDRLSYKHIFFIVKKNIGEIKREDYLIPEREDEYGTSILSIQFTKSPNNYVSIICRYNHSVSFPDSTFGNDLEKIIPGLTYAFKKYYGLIEKKYKNGFEIPGYTLTNEKKLYKYNYSINQVYYGDNYIIKNGKITKFSKEKCIVMDYFLLDLENKKITLFDESITDSFIDTIGNIKKIQIDKQKEEKDITIINENDEEFLIKLDKENNIIGFKSNDVKIIKDKFLYFNDKLSQIDLPNLKEVGNNFLHFNKELTTIEFINLNKVGNNFITANKKINKISLPSLIEIQNDFLYQNENITEIDLPNVKFIGDGFLYWNLIINKISMPNVEQIGSNFLPHNRVVNKIELSKLKVVGSSFLMLNKDLTELFLPSLEYASESFLESNNVISYIYLPLLKEAGIRFMSSNEELLEVYLPSLCIAHDYFLTSNIKANKFYMPNLQSIGKCFLKTNPTMNQILEQMSLPDESELKLTRVQ